MARVLFLSVCLLAGCNGARDLDTADAWVRSAPPSASVQAGYFTLHNRAPHRITLVGAHSSAFARVELHDTFTRGGITGMRRIERLPVPGDGKVEFAPGGRHLMLIDPKLSFAPGEQVEIVLELEGGAEHAFPAEVRRHGP